MKVVFGTTNRRKLEDVISIIESNHYDIEVLTLEDINWDLGEIIEDGNSLEENSLIKAKAVHDFCVAHHLNYPVIGDDAGLYVHFLGDEPGIYTARYADEERKENPDLPAYECLNKLLRKLDGVSDRSCYYRCVVTCMYPDGSYFQEDGLSYGYINEEIVSPIKKPYFYSLFILDSSNKTFNQLTKEELLNTYRYEAMDKTLSLIRKKD